MPALTLVTLLALVGHGALPLEDVTLAP